MLAPFLVSLAACWVTPREVNEKIGLSDEGDSDADSDVDADSDADGDVDVMSTTMGAADYSYQSGGDSPPWGEGVIIEDIDQGTVLASFAPYLTLDDTRELSFVVYESSNFNGASGLFTRLWKGDSNYSEGTGFCESPGIEVDLDPDAAYFLAVGGLGEWDDIWYADDEYPIYAGFGWATSYYPITTGSWPTSFQAIYADGYTDVDYTRIWYYYP